MQMKSYLPAAALIGLLLWPSGSPAAGARLGVADPGGAFGQTEAPVTSVARLKNEHGRRAQRTAGPG